MWRSSFYLFINELNYDSCWSQRKTFIHTHFSTNTDNDERCFLCPSTMRENLMRKWERNKWRLYSWIWCCWVCNIIYVKTQTVQKQALMQSKLSIPVSVWVLSIIFARFDQAADSESCRETSYHESNIIFFFPVTSTEGPLNDSDYF